MIFLFPTFNGFVFPVVYVAWVLGLSSAGFLMTHKSSIIGLITYLF